MKYELTLKEDGQKLVKIKSRTLADIVKKLNEKCSSDIARIKNI